MSKWLHVWLYSLILTLYLSFIALAAPPSPDFRNTYWGMTQEEVYRLEPLECLGADEKYLVYEDKISTYKVTTLYSFSNNALTSGLYIFMDRYKDIIEYITSLNNIKGLITLKYSDPSTDDFLMYDSSYSFMQPYSALKYGYGYYNITWETQTSLIILQLKKDGDDFVIFLIYLSKVYAPEVFGALTKGF